MTENSGESLSVAAASLGLAAAVFVFDPWTAPGIQVWFVSAILVALSSWTASRALSFVLAGLCSILTLFGLYLSLADLPVTVASINHSFGCGLLGIAAYSVAALRAQGQAPEKKSATLSHRILASVAGTGLLLVLLVVASYQTMRLYQQSAQVVTHTHEVLAELTAVLATLITAETGQRGCMLTTGHDTYVESCNRTLISLDEPLQRLKTLTQDNPVQKSGFPALEAKIAEKLAELRETAMAKQNEGPGTVLRIVMSDRRKIAMVWRGAPADSAGYCQCPSRSAQGAWAVRDRSTQNGLEGVELLT